MPRLAGPSTAQGNSKRGAGKMKAEERLAFCVQRYPVTTLYGCARKVLSEHVDALDSGLLSGKIIRPEVTEDLTDTLRAHRRGTDYPAVVLYDRIDLRWGARPQEFRDHFYARVSEVFHLKWVEAGILVTLHEYALGEWLDLLRQAPRFIENLIRVPY